MQRDFTYIDDIVESVIRVLDRVPMEDPEFDRQDPNPARSWAPYRVLNVGNHNPVDLMTYIQTLERILGKTAHLNLLPMQAGDVPATNADTNALRKLTGFVPATTVEQGIGRFVEWYRRYYRV